MLLDPLFVFIQKIFELYFPLKADDEAAGMNFREHRTLPIDADFSLQDTETGAEAVRFSPGSQDPLGQMPCHRCLFVNLLGNR